MPRYYNFGFEPYRYESNWQGYAVDPTMAAASTRQLGDVTNRSQFFSVPRRDDPFWLAKHNEKLPVFQVPESESPYYLHKAQQGQLLPASGLTPSGTEKQALVAIGVAGAAAFLLFSKRSPLRKALGR